MKTRNSINVRGSLREMEVGDIPLELPKPDYLIYSVRSAASALKVAGRTFEVKDTCDKIIIKRIS